MTLNSLIIFHDPFLTYKGLHKVPYYPGDDFKTNWEAFHKGWREVKKKREKKEKEGNRKKRRNKKKEEKKEVWWARKG